jgi:hypothetical protein
MGATFKLSLVHKQLLFKKVHQVRGAGVDRKEVRYTVLESISCDKYDQ